MPGQTALILGATGQTGRHLLKELLASPNFSQVSEYGRRVTNLESISSGKEKLQQKTIDFEKLNESGLKEGKWDVVFVTLGTTRKNAGSAEAFEKIDREYVINAAREARAGDKDQRLVYLSVSGANASSSFLYTKSKGLTELGLASLGYQDTIIFRPAMLTGDFSRPEGRPLETAARYVRVLSFISKAYRCEQVTTHAIESYVTGLLSHVSTSLEIKVEVLAKAIAKAGTLGSAALPSVAAATKEGKEGASFTVIGNPGAVALAKFES